MAAAAAGDELGRCDGSEVQYDYRQRSEVNQDDGQLTSLRGNDFDL